MEDTPHKPLYRVIVAGGRKFTQKQLLFYWLDRILMRKRTTHQIQIISGGCRGADALGEAYAKARGYALLVMPADWDRYGRKSAGPIRNRAMLRIADAVILFWDGTSKGSKDMHDITVHSGKPLRVIPYDNISEET